MKNSFLYVMLEPAEYVELRFKGQIRDCWYCRGTGLRDAGLGRKEQVVCYACGGARELITADEDGPVALRRWRPFRSRTGVRWDR